MSSSFNLRRLLYEKAQLEAAFDDGVKFFRYSNMPNDEWEAYGVEFLYCGFHVEGHYDDEHPYKRPVFQIDPEPSSRHYYDEHLCYIEPEKWSPSFTMATAVALVMRFLYEYRRGRTD